MSSHRLRRQSSLHHRTNDTVKFKTDLQKQCLLNCCEERKWVLTESGDDWNIYWANVSKIRKIFNLECGMRLRDDQIVNHYPNHYELTRKDLMVKNVKRYKKQLDKQGNKAISSLIDFVPLSYNLPADYPIFEQEFKKQLIHKRSLSEIQINNFNNRQRGTKWILKPSSRAQGSGIFIINRLSQLKKWTNSSKYNSNETYVIAKYIERPLLIGGRKFDLRLYALVTSYRPLKIYFYKQGFARFSNVKYTLDRDQMNNSEVHLTNVAIQKHSDEYNAKHGNKWSFSNVLLYIQSNFGNAKADTLQKQIKDIVIYSCLSVKNVLLNDKHCFECYGYDVIIDNDLKPWLIEINASPSLSATTKADRIFKRKLIFDLFQVVIPKDFPNIVQNSKTTQRFPNLCNRKNVGDFDLLYSELDENNNAEDSNESQSYNDIDSYNIKYNATHKRKVRNSWR